MDVKVKRIYEEPARSDGFRVLVDRVWPRGVSKEDAALDLWAKELAPSTELRKWYGHRPELFDDFRARYLQELEEHRERLEALVQQAGKRITVLTATKDVDRSNAAVVAARLAELAR